MIHLDSRTRTKLVWIATLFAPVMVVQGVRLAIGNPGAPAAASASPSQPAASAGSATPEKPLTIAQISAQKWLSARVLPATMRCPMDHSDPAAPEVVATDVPSASPDPTPRPGPAAGPLAGLQLTSMLAGRTEAQALASINKRIYRIGDEVVPGWRIRRIDTRRRLVTLTGPGGKTAALAPAGD